MVTRLQESTKHFALPGLCFNSAEAETLSRAFSLFNRRIEWFLSFFTFRFPVHICGPISAQTFGFVGMCLQHVLFWV
jgi:hypothetical protein